MSVPKVKVSVTLSADLLKRIDREAKSRRSDSRSAVMERWLRTVVYRSAEEKLAAETTAYYQALTDEERAEDVEWAEFSARSFSQLDIDGPPARKSRARRRR